ncbi:MAG: AsmA family protein [Immundisolibacteraceae bacterium]|nr:AsmA family protein [Immundisolibacteraceae bacterium]
MNRTVKVLSTVIAVVILLPVIAAIIASQVIDTDDIKQIAADQVASQTGRELTIDGDVDLSFFPWLSLDLGHTELSNAPGFSPPAMVEVDRISVSLKILPLLFGNIELDTLTLAGLHADLQINADGESNFADLVGSSNASSGETQESPTKNDNKGNTLAAFTLGGVEITDAQIRWRDLTSQTDVTVGDFNLRSGAILPGEPVKISIGAAVKIAEPALVTRIDSESTLEISDDFEQIALNQFDLTVTATGDTLPGGELSVNLSAELAADLKTDLLTVDQLQLKIANLSLNGDISVAQLSQAPEFKGSFKIASFDGQKLMDALNLPPIETADDAALEKLTAGFQVSGNENQIKLDALSIRVDQTAIDGQASIINFESPAIRFQLAIDAIDLDRYLPPASEASASDTSEAAGSENNEDALNLGESLAALATLNLNGSLTIGELIVAGIKSSDISVTVKADQGHLQIDPFSASLYEGKIDGSVDLNGAKNPPQVAVTHSLTGVSLAPLIKDLANVHQISGTANISTSFSTKGNQTDELTQNLNGKLKLEITDGTLQEINIDRSVCLARQGLKSISGDMDDSACPEDEPTRFTAFEASASVVNGVLSNKDLFIEQQRSDPDKFLHIKGDGQIDLNQQQINYRVTAGSVEKLADGSYEQRGTAIPVKISGNFDSPRVLPDVSGLVKSQAKSKLKEKLAPKLAPSDDDSPEDKLKKKLLKGLFN